MKSLKEHNDERREKWRKRGIKLNGIACPECGAELYDSNPGMFLLSNPPQLDVHCEECGYQGYRVA
jgi:DNA-directed RNA polymerase subunit RPC12/RpoP